MPLDEADLKHLWDMLRAARSAQNIIAGVSQEQYLRDEIRRFALERAIEIIGEAARRVSERSRSQIPLEWGAIIATRHIVAHEYDTIQHDTLWRIATLHIPEMIQVLAPVIDSNPPGPEAAKDIAEP
ncbi:MAG: DUF86 domain-containing protein [Phycisphaerales bacterium]